MTVLFGIAIALAIIDGALQYGWAEKYFRFGLPIFSIDLHGEPNGASTKYTVRKTAGGWMVRQKYYGLSRYATHHGYVTLQESGAGRCTFFIDMNVPFFGAFMVSAIVGPSVSSALLGAALAWLLVRLVAIRSAKSIAT